MNKIIIAVLFLVSCSFTKVKNRPMNTAIQETSSIYDFKVPLLNGEMVSLSKYKGKKMLIVNTASECGFTPQYEGLESLYEQYKDKVVVLGFPANNFGGQEPGSNAEIGAFCKKNYGVTFPVFSKISVVGKDMSPLYQWLTQKDKNGWNEDAPNWNFCKYLIDEQGHLIAFYASAVEPMSSEIIEAINK